MKLLRQIENLEALAHECGYQSTVIAWKLKVSTRTLQRYSLQHYRKPITDVLHQWRMAKAVAMVTAGKPLKEISHELGWTQYTNFCRAFTEWTGASPVHFLEGEIIPPFCRKHRTEITKRLRSRNRDCQR